MQGRGKGVETRGQRQRYRVFSSRDVPTGGCCPVCRESFLRRLTRPTYIATHRTSQSLADVPLGQPAVTPPSDDQNSKVALDTGTIAIACTRTVENPLSDGCGRCYR